MSDNLPLKDLLSTRQAARLYRCSEDFLTVVMKRHGEGPDHIIKSGGRLRYFWTPDKVLRVKAEEKLRKMEKRASKVVRQKQDRKNSRILWRVSMAERTRQKILAKLAARTAG